MSHISDSAVLMADYQWRAQNDLVVGDLILGADLKPATVTNIVTPRVSLRRVFSFQNNIKLGFTETDSFWAIENNRQWWWVENVAALHALWKSMPDPNHGLKIIDSFLVNYHVRYATLNGWESDRLVDITEQYTKESRLTFFSTDRCCPVIINGFVASGGLNEYRYDYTTFNWDHYQPILKQRLLDNNTLIC